MVVVQVDGLSGTGKSTLAAELSRRGYCAVDSDAEFAYFGDPETGKPTEVTTRDNWIWDLGTLRTFCEQAHSTPVFVCGGAMNQYECTDLFTRRFLLRIDNETMRQRLLMRVGNDFGKEPGELAELLELNRRASSGGRSAEWIVVDAAQPVEEVADRIIQIVLGPGSPPQSRH